MPGDLVVDLTDPGEREAGEFKLDGERGIFSIHFFNTLQWTN